MQVLNDAEKSPKKKTRKCPLVIKGGQPGVVEAGVRCYYAGEVRVWQDGCSGRMEASYPCCQESEGNRS